MINPSYIAVAISVIYFKSCSPLQNTDTLLNMPLKMDKYWKKTKQNGRNGYMICIRLSDHTAEDQMKRIQVTSTNTHRKCNKALSGEIIAPPCIPVYAAVRHIPCICSKRELLLYKTLCRASLLQTFLMCDTGQLLTTSSATILDL